MANIFRTIQHKRNHIATLSASEAKARILAVSNDLKDGEFIINSYVDAKAADGIADVLGIKAQGKVFFIDNQTILEKIGIKHDGTVDDTIDDSIIKDILKIAEKADSAKELIDKVIESCGLTDEGDYSHDAADKIIGTAATIADAVQAESDAIQALSAKTVTTVEDTDTVKITKTDSADGTKAIKADVKISSDDGNIIFSKADGIYTNVDYDPATNSLVVNGVKKQLGAGSIIDSLDYSESTEELIITYHTQNDSEPREVKVNLKQLIEEYSFTSTADDEHNVEFEVTRNVDGKSEVKANVRNIDCGEY